MNAFSKFNDRELPSIQGFCSKISEEKASQKDYDRALKAFNRFNLKDMGDYRDLCFLLTDVFENFRDLCPNYFGLDPAHVYTLPNFALDAMLSKAGMVIDMIYYSMIARGFKRWNKPSIHQKLQRQIIDTWVN